MKFEWNIKNNWKQNIIQKRIIANIGHRNKKQKNAKVKEDSSKKPKWKKKTIKHKRKLNIYNKQWNKQTKRQAERELSKEHNNNRTRQTVRKKKAT